MSADDAYLAFSRFGLGPRPGDLARIGSDPAAALLDEIADPTSFFISGPDLPDSVQAFTDLRHFQRARQLAKDVSGTPEKPMDALLPKAVIAANGRVTVPGVPSPEDLMNAEIEARLSRVRDVPIGFGERLVAFWANHFAVQAATNEVVRGLAGPFEREAIRPYVLGKFGDMALASTQHPAMLTSLNNDVSIGPNSPQGRKSGKGLNENLGRELMELHTVGVDGGYTQADVTSFAKVLTGWTYGHNESDPEHYGSFVFHNYAHEPGPQTVMGKVYAQKGVDQGLAVIADLARHPATAKHIASQFAGYFVADNPPASLVSRLADVFQKTQGDLKALTIALVKSPEAWSTPVGKLRTPQEFLWASARAVDFEANAPFINRTLNDLGEPLWNPPSPQGFKDDAATWLAPDAMTTRVDVAELVASRTKGVDDPRQLATDLFGASLSSDTQTAIDRAESRNQALALLLMSPEFQRR
jgi:uncharacterized protein (DUF1800 family)